MKKLLSVVLALLMLAVMLPVTAMAEEGDPTCVNGVWQNVTSANVQDVLDGKYGSIDNTTIVLTAGTYGQLELGRATKHPGSNTKTYLLKSAALTERTIDQIKDEIAAHPGGGYGTPYYVRTMNNVTMKAAEGAAVTINGIKMNSAQIAGANGNVKYDYVLEREVPDNNESFKVIYDANNLCFEGLTFKKIVNIENLLEETSINGVSFKNCKFDINNTENALENYGIRFYSEFNNGRLKNLVVDNCEFNGCRLAVYSHHIYNVSVTNSNFNTTGHNAIAVQDHGNEPCNHGEVVITGNNFKNIGDRIIRFNNVGEGTTITISKNTSTNSGKSNGEIVAAETLPKGMKVTMTNNNWGKVGDRDPVFGTGFVETTTGGTIVIITPTEDTPKTEPEKNPTTGANDMVAAAAALMAVSALGMAVLSRKK